MNSLDNYIITHTNSNSYFQIGDIHFEDEINLKQEVVQYIRINKIDSISITYLNSFTKMNSEFLKQIPWTKNLIIIKLDLNLNGLQYLTELEFLHVEPNNSQDIDFSFHNSLKKVSIKWTKGRNSIFKCKSVTDIHLFNYRSNDLSSFINLSNLNSIGLTISTIKSMFGIELLATKLKCVSLRYCSKLEDLSPLKKLTGLNKLELFSIPKLTSLSFLINSTIQIIGIEKCKSIKDINHVFSLKNLKVLGLIDSVPFTSISEIPKLSNLESFYIGHTNIIDGDLKPLLNLKNLKRCFITNRKHYNLKNSDIKLILNIKD
ncbi:MAG TPA: hypothetical protein PK431_12430 [Chitinophagales bacterium]|nr:hypothetical protein [Chitinophagales bacterium]